MADPAEAGSAGDGRPPVPDELAYPFSFEKQRKSLRSTEAARPGIEVLLSRLSVPAPAKALKSDRVLERQLLLFGVEVLLNIDYYVARTRREEKKQWAMNGGIYGLAAVFVGVALYLFLSDRSAIVAASSQLAAIAGAVLAGAKFLTEGQDFQKTRSSFWEAAAELKERLYLFINEWCGRAWDADQGVFVPDFVIALQAEIKKARDIQVEERRRFYDLMATPSRLLGATQQLSGDAQMAVSQFVQGAQLREEQRKQHEVEQVDKERQRLWQSYPDDGTRPATVRSRLAELDARIATLQGGGQMTVTTQVAAGVTTTTPTAGPDLPGGSGAAGVPFDGRHEPGVIP